MTLLLALVAVASVALVLGVLAALAVASRRSGRAGAALAGAMAAYDEAMHTTAHSSYEAVRADARRTVPAEAPDGEPGARGALPRAIPQSTEAVAIRALPAPR